MAIYIEIVKDNETAEYARYSFSDFAGRSVIGFCQIDKSTGEVTRLGAGSESPTDGVYLRVARKLFLHWQVEEFPEKTQWAA